MRLRRALLPLLLLATVPLAACGGGSSDSSASPGQPASTSSGATTSTTPTSGGTTAACDLLTTDEVAAAVGSPVKQGIPSTGPSITGGTFSTCLWQSDDPDHPADQATVTIYPNAAAADSVRDDQSQDVPGIGDKAFTGSVASVWVYVGQQSFFAQWYTFSGTDADNLPRSEALAKAAADAL